MKARFRTNLDEVGRYVRQLNEADLDSRDFIVGDRVNFLNSTGTKGFCLEVVQRKIICKPAGHPSHTEIELHMPSYETRAIRDWCQSVREHMDD